MVSMVGTSAARKYDCEAWVPTQERYRELTSTSNCTDFQARRLSVRFRDDDGRTRPVATLSIVVRRTLRESPCGMALAAGIGGAVGSTMVLTIVSWSDGPAAMPAGPMGAPT